MIESDHPTYDLGTQAIVIVRYKDLAGLPADPTTLSIQVQRGRSTIQSFTQASPEVAHPATGEYQLTLPEFTQGTVWGSGKYHVWADGDGTVEAGKQSWFKVRPLRLV